MRDAQRKFIDTAGYASGAYIQIPSSCPYYPQNARRREPPFRFCPLPGPARSCGSPSSARSSCKWPCSFGWRSSRQCRTPGSSKRWVGARGRGVFRRWQRVNAFSFPLLSSLVMSRQIATSISNVSQSSTPDSPPKTGHDLLDECHDRRFPGHAKWPAHSRLYAALRRPDRAPRALAVWPQGTLHGLWLERRRLCAPVGGALALAHALARPPPAARRPGVHRVLFCPRAAGACPQPRLGFFGWLVSSCV